MAAKQIKGQASMEAGTNGTGSVVTVEFPLPDNSAVL
jgi:hypothetical protein